MGLTRDYVRAQLPSCKGALLKGPLLVIVHFRLPQPLKTKDKQAKHEWPHSQRPDGDNLEKFLNDALNGYVWEDDARIAWMLRSKSWTKDRRGSTTLYVKEIPTMGQDYKMIIEAISENLRIQEEDEPN